jgi:rhodanese-related sulfurtransferase
VPIAAPLSAPFTAEDLDRLRGEHPDVRVVDVRTPVEFSSRHIPGSYNVPLAQLDEHRAELTSADIGPVVLVCESGRRAGVAEERLADAGLGSVHVLAGGVAGWEARGLELARAPGDDVPWALERQVRLVAGGIVATAVAATVVWPPARFFAGAVGLGLVLAAVTDTCAMGLALARLPYNTRSRTACDLPNVVATITAPEESRS